MLRLLGAICLLLVPSVSASRSLPECRYDRSLSTVEALVESSTGVYLITVAGFEASEETEFGTYRANVVSTIYGEQKQVLTLRGFAPPPVPNQYYFDLTEHHSNFRSDNLNANFGRGLIFEKAEGRCQIFPDFIEGYNYLVFLGVNHELAFEPINSITSDKWLQMVKERSVSLSKAD
jgi:hypothetical protein